MKQRSETEKQSRKRIRRLISIQSRREFRLTPGFQSHEALLEVVKELPTDFEPYGERERLSEDCSCGCRWFHILDGTRGQDWGVCANPKSPRAGLLTFEHQGCPEFGHDIRFDFLETAAGRKMLQRHRKAEQELRESRERTALRPTAGERSGATRSEKQ
jgi:hypothetical protein